MLTATKYDPYLILDQVFAAFTQGKRLVPIITQLKLTKTQRAVSEALLLNDTGLRQDVLQWLELRSSEKQLLGRYHTEQMPHHFPARVVNGLGSICSGQNIFLFFPNCLGVEGRQTQDYFGIELIDIWANIFQKAIFPCARAVLTVESQVELLTEIGVSLDKTIYLASIFHELGHQRGSWRVSPAADPRLKVSPFYLDVFGEMATDSLLVQNLSEFPEISVFVILQRLFWFGRRGFRDNPHSALINQDNDSWLSALLWNRLRRAGALTPREDRWAVDLDRARCAFQELSANIEQLGAEVLTLENQVQQDQFCLSWMQNEVQWIEEAGFLLPLELRTVYRRTTHIEEIPHFQPLAEPFGR